MLGCAQSSSTHGERVNVQPGLLFKNTQILISLKIFDVSTMPFAADLIIEFNEATKD